MPTQPLRRLRRPLPLSRSVLFFRAGSRAASSAVAPAGPWSLSAPGHRAAESKPGIPGYCDSLQEIAAWTVMI
jgi:hypothetical protein